MLRQHLARLSHGTGLVYGELGELLWGGGLKLLLHWSSWKKMSLPKDNEFQGPSPRGGLRAQLPFGSFPQGRLGKYREIKRDISHPGGEAAAGEEGLKGFRVFLDQVK